MREPILPTWQCSCKERRKQAALARWAKDHPAREPSVYPAWHVPNPEWCMGKSLPPLAGDGAPMKKMLAFFSWVPGKVAAGRKGEYKTRIYPAWQQLTNPAFIPLGAVREASVRPA